MGSTPDQIPLIVVVGETASGKTATAIEIAKQVDGEIICADSRTVYKGMNIGTAKPTLAEQKEVPHYLLDLIWPNEQFSAAEFKTRAEKCIQDIQSRGKIPIVVGGTGLYVDALLYDFRFGSKADETLRSKLEQMNDDELTTVMNTKSIDQTNLNTKNRRHVIRAIERGGVVTQKKTLREDTVILGIQLERAILKERVHNRIKAMFESGFLDEAAYLFKNYGDTAESLQTPGYRAAKEYFSDQTTLSDAKLKFEQADLRLAKRQRTWFKRNTDIMWFEDPKDLIEKAVEFTATLHYN